MTIHFSESKEEETEQPWNGYPAAQPCADAGLAPMPLKRRRARVSERGRDGLCIIVLGSDARSSRQPVRADGAKIFVEEAPIPAPPRRKQGQKSSQGEEHWCVFDPGLGDAQPRRMTIDA